MDEKRKTNIFPILLGIIVLLFIAGAIAMGFLYSSKTSDQIFESGIDKVFNQILKVMDVTEFKEIDFKKNDLSLKGDFHFDTSLNKEELNDFKNSKYHFELDESATKKIIKYQISKNEENENVIKLKQVIQNDKSYFYLPSLFSTTIEMDSNFSFLFQIIQDRSTLRESEKNLIKDLRDSLVESIDKTKITIRKNILKEYNGKEAKTAEFVYTMNEENKDEMKGAIQNVLRSHEKDFENQKELYQLLTMQVNSVFSFIDQIKEIVVTTTGVLHDVVAIEVQSENDAIYYVDYNNKQMVSFNGVQIEISKEGKDLVFNMEIQDINGTIRLHYDLDKNKHTIDFTLSLHLTNKGETYDFAFDGTLDYESSVEEEEITDSKKLEEITLEENEMYTKFITKIREFILENIKLNNTNYFA